MDVSSAPGHGLFPRLLSGLVSKGRIAAMMARSGLLRPGPPARMAGQLLALRRWGTLLCGSFTSAAARDPERVAVIDEQGSLTYAEMEDRANRLAAALTGTGRAAVLCRNGRGMLLALLACGKAGADVVLLNTGLGTAQLLTVIGEHGVELLLADDEFAELLASVPPGVRAVGTGGFDELIAAAGEVPAPAPPARTGRTIVLSSGTSGPPKGADRKSRPGLEPLASMLSRIPLRVHDTALIEAPLFHTWGYAALQMAVGLRATLVFRARFDPEQALAAVAGARANVLFAVPVMLQRIMELPAAARRGHDTSALSIVAVSGSALPGGLATAFMDAFGDVLYNLYGSTESSWVTIATPADLRAAPDSAGTPPPGTRLAILGADGRPVPPGEPGRIFAANELLFSGYTNGAAKESRDGMIGLGDTGRIDGHGRLHILGRDDDMVVSGGENVFPGAVEEVIGELPQVREVAVTGVPDERFGQRLAAYVVSSGGLTADAVRGHVRSRLARFAVPRDVRFVAELPRNATGKVVRSRLADTPPGQDITTQEKEEDGGLRR